MDSRARCAVALQLIMDYLPGILTAYAILVVGVLSPGPAVALLIGIATGQGRLPAMITTLGIAFGSMTINLTTMLGVGLLLSQAAWAMNGLRLIGACYLLFLAFSAFSRALHPPALTPAQAAPYSKRRYLILGYLMQVTNPKAIAFWIPIAAIGAVEGGGPVWITLFVAGAFIISFCGHALWALTMSAPPIRRAYAGVRRWVESALGAFFTFAAWQLAGLE